MGLRYIKKVADHWVVVIGEPIILFGEDGLPICRVEKQMYFGAKGEWYQGGLFKKKVQAETSTYLESVWGAVQRCARMVESDTASAMAPAL